MIIGGTSRDAEGVVVAVEGDCDMVVGDDDAVIWEEGVASDGVVEVGEELEGVSWFLSSVEIDELLLASGFRETPRSCWISSGLRPLDSRKEILRSVGESRIDSSSRNLDAWSSSSCRVVGAGASSELGDGEEAGD